MDFNQKNNIINKLHQLGFNKKLITYDEFKKIYSQYEVNCKETEFAGLLGIRAANICRIKKGGKAKILLNKNNEDFENRRNLIISELTQKGYSNKMLDYEGFKMLYKSYADDLTELQFAGILEIHESNYFGMKNKNTKVAILNEEWKRNFKQTKQDIYNNIKEEGKINTLISYSEFKKLYDEYANGMSEIRFASMIGIKASNFCCMKSRGTKVTVLKTKIEDMPKNVINETVEDLKKHKYENKMISYNIFKELYNKYGKNMTEVQLAKVIGISECNYYAMKNKNQRAQVDFNYNKKQEVKDVCKESTFYDIETIDKIIKDKKITKEEFIKYIFNLKNNSEMIEEYKQSLEKNKKLYIGKTIINKEFMNNNATIILDYINKYSNNYGKRFNMLRVSEDIASDVILLIMEKYGEVTYNFDTDKSLEILKKISAKAVKYKYFQNMKISPNVSLDEAVQNKDGKKYSNYKILEDKSVNIEDDIDNYIEL